MPILNSGRKGKILVAENTLHYNRKGRKPVQCNADTYQMKTDQRNNVKITKFELI